MSLPLPPAVFAILGGLIEERLGLSYSPADRDLLAAKVAPRALELGFESLLDYYYFLRYDPAGADELHALADHLVVGETYLFRERDQLDVLVHDLIAQQLDTQPRVRLWSAACATGEEPLTIAMMLAQKNLLDRVEIVATDLSRRAIAAARAGRLSRRAVRAALPPAAAPFVTVAPNGVVTVAPELVARVTFAQVNLIDDAAVAALGRFDFILCRNALIYFNDATTTRTVHRLSRALTPRGVLLVGVSESLLRFGTLYECHEARGVFYYRKAAS